MNGQRVTHRRTWSVPGHLSDYSDGCDCYWHNRKFMFVARGHSGPDSDDILLSRTITRTDFAHGGKHWLIEAEMDGCRIRVERAKLTTHTGERLPGADVDIRYCAWLDLRSVTLPLVRLNPHAVWTEYRTDPTLIFGLPAGMRLVVWRQAWWWQPDLEPIDGPDVHMMSA